jgi:hypothetical protein
MSQNRLPLRAETEQVLVKSYPALPVTGEMILALRGMPGSERLIEYEAKPNEFVPGSRCLAICQYGRRRLAPEMAGKGGYRPAFVEMDGVILTRRGGECCEYVFDDRGVPHSSDVREGR